MHLKRLALYETCVLRKLWDALTGAELKSFSHNHIVRSVDLSHDSQTLLTASKQCLYLYNLELPDEGTLNAFHARQSCKLSIF